MFNIFRLMRTSSKDAAIDQDSLNRQQRMAEKREQAIRELGDKYILHPKHKVTKLDKPRSY